MTRTSAVSRANLDLVEEYQSRWREDPGSVDESWRHFFEGYDLGAESLKPAAAPYGGSPPPAQQAVKAVTRLVDAYREMGHNLADLDPLRLVPRRQTDEQLELANFDLTEADLDRDFYSKLGQEHHGTLREILDVLRDTYCRTIGVEYMHIRDLEIRRWLFERMEPVRNRPKFDLKKKRWIIYKLNEAELFETFLHKNFVGQKRFSLEGGEMLIPLLDAIIERAGKEGVQDIVMGMPHRGRLNVLANILQKPYGVIFSEFEGNMPETVAGDGDVKYHLGFSADHVTQDKRTIHLTLTPNPSHLEAVNPVVEGRTRAKQRRSKDAMRKLGMPILIHGDAAFAGQGLVAETLNLSQLPGYSTGGTIHIVVNNQIGFTTAPIDSRSTRYCTDVAKMIEAPIFHVNGEDPEAVVHVGELATDFRQRFGRDVVIDMVCYRRHGHNEGDEPGFTQPLMYDTIKNRITVRELYTEKLVLAGELTSLEAETIAETFADKLAQVLEEVKRKGVEPRTVPPGFASGPWAELTPNFSFEPVETGAPHETLRHITAVPSNPPAGFTPNHKLVRIFQARVKTAQEKGPVDWSHAEALAFGSLLMEGTPVRLSGQDSRRGTFSQRHAVLIDQLTGQPWVWLNDLGVGQAQFCVYDSMLSEAAVLGFDYGYSLDEPHMLIMWEAQFGDFANGAQVIIDQFIASAESKWGRGSGLVMLLPHGYEGQGPEHSSARLERFLQLCAEQNIQVCYPSNPAQYFHLLRRQVRRNFRKPLIVMTPKSLLRRKECTSPIDALTVGGFKDVLDDPAAPKEATRLCLCTGKVYYDLAAKRAAVGKEKDVAIVRVEQLYPFPAEELKKTLLGYPEVRDWVWVQEESQNMGAWAFIAPRLEELMGFQFQYVGRDASASPATGSKLIHDREQTELVEAAVGAAVPHLVSATPVRSLAAAGSREGAR